jgi:high-affinity Fe2+/Pb2+ permease
VRIPISTIDFPRVELLGLYPTLQSLLAQVAVTLAALTVIWWHRRGRPEARPVPNG